MVVTTEREFDIKAIRERMGLRQEAFARLLGVSLMTVNRWERGHFKPSLMAQEKIERLLERHGGK